MGTSIFADADERRGYVTVYETLRFLTLSALQILHALPDEYLYNWKDFIILAHEIEKASPVAPKVDRLTLSGLDGG